MQCQTARQPLQILPPRMPRSYVKSPLVILAHHVISAAYCLIPFHYRKVRQAPTSVSPHKRAAAPCDASSSSASLQPPPNLLPCLLLI